MGALKVSEEGPQLGEIYNKKRTSLRSPPPENPDISTARREAFSERIDCIFTGYEPPSFFKTNFEGLCFVSSYYGLQPSWPRPKMAKKLGSVAEDLKPEEPKPEEPKQTRKKGMYYQFLGLIGL